MFVTLLSIYCLLFFFFQTEYKWGFLNPAAPVSQTMCFHGRNKESSLRVRFLSRSSWRAAPLSWARSSGHLAVGPAGTQQPTLPLLGAEAETWQGDKELVLLSSFAIQQVPGNSVQAMRTPGINRNDLHKNKGLHCLWTDVLLWKMALSWK